MKIQKKTRILTLVALAASLVFAPATFADEWANAQKLLNQSMQIIANNPSVLKGILHPGSNGLDKFEGCEDADKPGWGLSCRPPGPVSESDEKHYTVVDYNMFQGVLGGKLTELVKYTSENTGFVKIIWKTWSIADHIHEPDCSGNNCESQYIKLADETHFAWAFGQSSKFDITAPVTGSAAKLFGGNTMQASFKKKKFVGGYYGPVRYCGYKDHDGDTYCGSKPKSCETGGGEPGNGEPGNGEPGNGDTGNDTTQNGFGSSTGDWWEAVTTSDSDEVCPCDKEPTDPDATHY